MTTGLEQDIKAIEKNIVDLNKTTTVHDVLISRLDKNVEKLSDLQGEIAGLVKLHDTKIVDQVGINRSLSELIERNRQDSVTDLRDLNNRMTAEVGAITSKIDVLRDEIRQELKSLREDINQRRRDDDEERRDKKTSVTKSFDELLNKWKYIIFGLGLGIGIALHKISLISLLSTFFTSGIN